jgi:hypothetical protein
MVAATGKHQGVMQGESWGRPQGLGWGQMTVKAGMQVGSGHRCGMQARDVQRGCGGLWKVRSL